jgi:hypothetical protein
VNERWPPTTRRSVLRNLHCAKTKLIFFSRNLFSVENTHTKQQQQHQNRFLDKNCTQQKNKLFVLLQRIYSKTVKLSTLFNTTICTIKMSAGETIETAPGNEMAANLSLIYSIFEVTKCYSLMQNSSKVNNLLYNEQYIVLN